MLWTCEIQGARHMILPQKLQIYFLRLQNSRFFSQNQFSVM